MLDEFMKVAYAKSQREQEQLNLHNLLKQLPVEDLYKLATGEVTKQAYMDAACSPKAGSDSSTWIDRFKNTPLFDQAVSLEQEEIQLEMDELQKRKERQAQSQMEQGVWELRDQLRLKKRLLELQAAQVDITGQLPQAEEEQGAGAVGAEAPNPEQTVQETSSKVAMAETMGRQLARQDFKKEASQRNLLTAGDTAGRLMSKVALDMNAAKGLGQGAMNFLKGNRGAALGAAAGAAGGLAQGLQADPATGQRSLMKGLAGGALGAAGGAAVGHGAQHFTKALPHAGGNVGEALKATGSQLKYQGQQAATAIKGALGGGGGAPRVVTPAPHGFPSQMPTTAGLGTAKTVAAPAASPGALTSLAQKHMQQLGFNTAAGRLGGG